MADLVTGELRNSPALDELDGGTSAEDVHNGPA